MKDYIQNIIHYFGYLIFIMCKQQYDKYIE
jgi:hypothetical protein